MSEKMDETKLAKEAGQKYYVILSMDFYGYSADMTKRLTALLREERMEPFLMEEVSRRRLNRGLLVALFKHFGVTRLWMSKRLSCSTIIMLLEDYKKLFEALYVPAVSESAEFTDDSMRRFACQLLLRFENLKRDATGDFSEYSMTPIEAHELPSLLMRKVSLNDASTGYLPLIRDCGATKCSELSPYSEQADELIDSRVALYMLEPGKTIYREMLKGKLEINHNCGGCVSNSDLIGEPAAIAIAKSLKVNKPCIAVIENTDTSSLGTQRGLVTDKDGNPLVFNASHTKTSNAVISEDAKDVKDLKASKFSERYCICNDGMFNVFKYVPGSVSVAKSK